MSFHFISDAIQYLNITRPVYIDASSIAISNHNIINRTFIDIAILVEIDGVASNPLA